MLEQVKLSCRIAIFLDHKGNAYTCEDSAGAPQQNWCSHKDFEPDKIFSSRGFRPLSRFSAYAALTGFGTGISGASAAKRL